MSNKKAFILMPFAEDFSDVYKYLIVDGLGSAGYTVKRADNILSQNNIIEDIVKEIFSSDLIVADLTGSNPNVYYELGISHALDKKVILITQDIKDLPFDLRSYRVISYSVHFAKMNQAKEELTKLASEAIKGNLPFGNPVKDFCKNLPNKNEKLISIPEYDNIGEYGLLDYEVKLEEDFEELTELFTAVSLKLENDLTPAIIQSTDKLNSENHTAKQKLSIIRELAASLQNYGEFIKYKNERYRVLLNDIGTSFESLLSREFEVNEETEIQLQEFFKNISGMEDSAFDARQGFLDFIESIDSIPKVEKNFYRAKIFTITELKDFVNNLDQTMAVTSRVKRLSKSLIEKNNNQPKSS